MCKPWKKTLLTQAKDAQAQNVGTIWDPKSNKGYLNKDSVDQKCKSYETTDAKGKGTGNFPCRDAQETLYNTYLKYADHLSQATHVEIAKHVADLRLLINEMATAKAQVESRKASMSLARQKVITMRIDSFTATIKALEADLNAEIKLKAEFEKDSENVMPKLKLLSQCMDLPVSKQAEEIRLNEKDTTATFEEFKTKINALHQSMKDSVATFSSKLDEEQGDMKQLIDTAEKTSQDQDKIITDEVTTIGTSVTNIRDLEKKADISFQKSYTHLLHLAGQESDITKPQQKIVELLQMRKKSKSNAHQHVESIAASRTKIKNAQKAIKAAVNTLGTKIEDESNTLQTALLTMMSNLNGFRDKTSALKNIMISKVTRTEGDQERLFDSLQTTINSIVTEMNKSVKSLTATQTSVNGFTNADFSGAKAACTDQSASGDGKACDFTSKTTGKTFTKCVKKGDEYLCSGKKTEIAADVLLEPFKEAPPVDAPPPLEDSLEDEQLVKPDEIVVEDGKK